jgi:hypothetical protein
MAGEIQLNSTTFATESSGTITVSNVDSATNRTNLGLGSIATQAADSVSISGGNITGGTIGSSVVFPAGHILRNFYSIGDGSGDDAVTSTLYVVYDGVELEITGTNDTNDFLVIIYTATVGSVGTAFEDYFAGLVYSTDNFSTSTQLGPSTYYGRTISMDDTFDKIDTLTFCTRVSYPTTSTYKIRIKHAIAAGTQTNLFNSAGPRPMLTAFEVKG